MVAAGSGVTPFISYLKEVRANREVYPYDNLSLLVAYRSPADLMFYDQLQELAKENYIDIHIYLTRKNKSGFGSGRPNEKILDKLFAKKALESTFFTCGPVPMMSMVLDWAKAKGVAEDDRLMESFES